MISAIAVTLLSEWIAVAVRASHAKWDGATGLQVGLLVVMKVLACKAGINLRRTSDPTLIWNVGTGTPSDWLTEPIDRIATTDARTDSY